MFIVIWVVMEESTMTLGRHPYALIHSSNSSTLGKKMIPLIFWLVYFSLLEVKISIIALILLLHSFKMVHTAYYPPFVPSYLIITVCSTLLNFLHFNPTHSLPPYFEKGPFLYSNGVYFEEKNASSFLLSIVF